MAKTSMKSKGMMQTLSEYRSYGPPGGGETVRLFLAGPRPSRPVVALTEATAAIQSPTGALTIFRRHNKPALGPVGDTLDDLQPPFGGSVVRRQL
jgi:hypothetical protein